MNVKNHKEFACCSYISTTDETAYQLGDIVIKKYDDKTIEIGVIIQLHDTYEFRTDMWGNCSSTEIELATFAEIEKYRSDLIDKLQYFQLRAHVKGKQVERLAAIFPNDSPRYVRCYDNGGESLDRYTVVFTGNYTHKTGGEFQHLGMNSQPFHGIGMHGSSKDQIDKPTYSHLGKKIKFQDLPSECQKCVNQSYLYLWDFTDDRGNTI